MTEPNASASDRLILGDCVEGLRSLEAGSVRPGVRRPSVQYRLRVRRLRRPEEADDYLEWSRTLDPRGGPGAQARRHVLAGDRRRVRRRAEDDRPPRAGALAAELGDLVLHVRGQLQVQVQPEPRALTLFRERSQAFTFNTKTIRVPSARQLVYADLRANPKGRLPDDTWILRPQDVPGGFGADEDTWYVPRVCGTFKERAGWHGCQMPEQLLGRIIRACSNPGDLVLDPFAGSGTTLTVARKLRRRYLGFELSPDYAERARARLLAAEPGQPLEGADEPKVTDKPRRTRKSRERATG